MPFEVSVGGLLYIIVHYEVGAIQYKCKQWLSPSEDGSCIFLEEVVEATRSPLGSD